MLSKFLDPKNDFAFRKIFGTEQNQEILIHFLNDVLAFEPHCLIKEVSFLPTIQNPEISSQKTSIVDILCKDQHAGHASPKEAEALKEKNEVVGKAYEALDRYGWSEAELKHL